MREELNNVIQEETKAIEELLKALEKQHKCLIKSDALTIENCTIEIKECSRKVAEHEVKRREITMGKPMRQIIDQIGDEELEKNYRKIKRLLEETKLQKDTNELLIRQGLSFTGRVLNILNPSRAPKTYNSYGKIFK